MSLALAVMSFYVFHCKLFRCINVLLWLVALACQQISTTSAILRKILIVCSTKLSIFMQEISIVLMAIVNIHSVNGVQVNLIPLATVQECMEKKEELLSPQNAAKLKAKDVSLRSVTCGDPELIGRWVDAAPVAAEQ